MNKTFFSTRRLNGKRTIYSLEDSQTLQTLLGLSKFLRKRHITSLTRDEAIARTIRQLSAGLTNLNNDGSYKISKNITYTIIRGDIKDFFPSINKHILYSKITQSSKFALNNIQRKALADLLLDPNFIGLPQGISISSILAEIYLEEFDTEVRNNFPECTYIRYVDDFLIICPTLISHHHNFKSTLIDLLSKYQLSLSVEKFKKLNLTKNTHFFFLGYKFSREEKQLVTTIDPKKIKKIQNRINETFRKYRISRLPLHSKQTKLYFKLLNTLCGVTTMSPDTLHFQHFGIPYSYKYITNSQGLQKIINNIEYQIKHTSSIQTNLYLVNKIKKLYLPYCTDESQSRLQKVLLNYRYNYTNLSRSKLISFIVSLDSSFHYSKQNKNALLHIFFNLLYNSKLD